MIKDQFSEEFFDIDYYNNETEDEYIFDYEIIPDDQALYEEDYFEDQYTLQQVGFTLVFLATASVALLVILTLSWVQISVPESTEIVANLEESRGLKIGSIAPLFTPEVQYWSENIVQWSQQTGIDANLIATVMQIESCGDPFATSSVGAMGLFQVMPYHFERNEDPYKPATNAKRGLDFLQQALAARGDSVYLGLAGYNGGITGAKRPESQWANETQRYVYWGTGIYEDAVKGKGNSERLDEWLGRGGVSLCRQAAQRLGINP